MIYYSTGKNPYQRRRGVPCEPHPATAESLVKKGYLVRTLDEAFGRVIIEAEKVEVVHPDILPTITVEVRDIPKVERKPKAEKKVKPKKNSKKVTKK
jgi:hypothetical protein